MPSGNRNITVNAPDDPSFVNAENLEVGDYLLIPKTRQSEQSQVLDLKKYNGKANNSHMLSSVKVNKDLGWLLGIYAAEGCSHPDRSAIEFSFNRNEIDLINKTSRLLKKLFNLDAVENTCQKNNVTKVRICSRALARFFLDSVGMHAHDKRLKGWIHSANDEFLFAFIRGYLDGDGCIVQNGLEKGKWRLMSSSPYLINDLQSISLTLGLWASACKSRNPKTAFIQGRECKTRGLWELSIMPFGNKRKNFKEDSNYYYVPIKSIKSEHYNGTVYNFETSGEKDSDHTYVVGNIITHNCDGDYFHNRPEQVKNDKERDFLLAQRGWTILRFNDKTINEIPQKVKSTILSYIKKALSGTKEAQKNPVIFFTVQNGELKDISGEYDRYLKQVHKISYSEIHHKNGQNTIKNQSEMFE